MGDEDAIGDFDAAMGVDDRAHQGAIVADGDFSAMSQVEEGAVVKAGIVAYQKTDRTPAAIVPKSERAVQIGVFAQKDIFRQWRRE